MPSEYVEIFWGNSARRYEQYRTTWRNTPIARYTVNNEDCIQYNWNDLYNGDVEPKKTKLGNVLN